MRGKPLDGSKNPGGRPRKHWLNCPPEVIAKKVTELATMGLLAAQIESFLGFSHGLLQKSYSPAYTEGYEACNAKILSAQLQVAIEKRDGPMLKWLGQQRCGQRDRSEISGPNGGAIPVTYEAASSALMEFLAESKRRINQSTEESVQ